MCRRNAWWATLALAIVLFLPIDAADAAILVGYWDFEELAGNTVFDSSTFGNDGQLTGATRTTTGKIGRGLNFDGTGGVTVPNSPSLDSLPGGFTMSAWIKPSSYPDFTTIFFKTDRFNLIHQLHFQVDGRLTTVINQAASLGGYEAFTGNVIPLDDWTYVAWTYDETTSRVYINGTEVQSAPFSDPWVGNTRPLQIGQHNQLPISHFQGMIDEPRIYRGALTRDEILNDMNPPPPGPVIPEPASLILFGSGLLGLGGWRRRKAA